MPPFFIKTIWETTCLFRGAGSIKPTAQEYSGVKNWAWWLAGARSRALLYLSVMGPKDGQADHGSVHCPFTSICCLWDGPSIKVG